LTDSDYKMKKGEIWFVDLLDGKGHEQKGERPAIILGKANKMVFVIPLTSSTERATMPFTIIIEQTPTTGLTTDSVALIFQLISLDESRFKNRIGCIEEKQQEELDIQIKEMLKIK